MALSKSFVAACVISALFGASATLAYQGKAYDLLYLDNQKLQDENKELAAHNEQLTKRLNHQMTEPVIESIHVEADAPDGLSEIEAIQLVKQDLAFLIGKPLDTLQRVPDLPYRLLNNHPITVDGQQYQMTVKTVVVGSVLYVAVSVSENKQS